MPKEPIKTYILDTSVLIHAPTCLTRFAENDVCIPSEVLQELDKLKVESTARGQAARSVQRALFKLFPGNNPLTEGAKLPGGGMLFISINSYLANGRGLTKSTGMRKLEQVGSDLTVMDNRILANAVYVSETRKPPVILVTKDLNLHLKARAIGILAQDYQNDRADAAAEEFHKNVEVSSAEMQRFAASGRVELDGDRMTGLMANDYVTLANGKKLPARLLPDGRTFARLLGRDGINVPKGIHINPMNLGQHFLLDALLNPDISLVTVEGPAGTGKTLLTVAAGLSMIGRRTYDGISISRPVVSMGDGIGFIPGTLADKMAPWVQPYFDAFTFLLTPRTQGEKVQSDRKQRRQGAATPSSDGIKPAKPWEQLVASGVLDIEALCYIRGRSIPGRIFVLDESQQLTPHEAKTVVTRISKGAKLIMLGDPAQIDNPYVDSLSNGLVYTRTKMRGLPMSAHVSLQKCERSPLSEAAAGRM